MAITVKSIPLGPVSANTYILTDVATNECAVIDAGDFNEALKKELDGKKVKYILLTHGHFDHILGVEKFQSNFNVDTYMAKEDEEQVEAAPKMIQYFTGVKPPEFAKITHFVKDGDEFFIGRTKIKAISTPGHTQGGMCYLVADKDLFSGDTLFFRSVGRTDFPGGSFETIKKSVKDVLFNLSGDVVVHPGHGPKSSIGYEKKFNEIINI